MFEEIELKLARLNKLSAEKSLLEIEIILRKIDRINTDNASEEIKEELVRAIVDLYKHRTALYDILATADQAIERLTTKAN